MENHPYAKIIWDKLIEDIGNEYGVAGLMGNLRAESGLYPDRVQGDVPYSDYSKEYTAQVDSGEISRDDFIYNGPNGGGYGLAQWTYYTRKEALYDVYQLYGYPSIGSVDLACAYLLAELKSVFPDVYEVLKSADSIREASNIVLHEFEAPADQSTAVEELREDMGIEIYNLFSGSEPGTGGNTGGGNTGGNTPSAGTNKKLSKLLLYMVATEY